MTTHTLVANTALSALSLADGDTIVLSTFTLNMDVVPTAINVIVGSTTTGKITLLSSTNYPLTGWVMTAGTGPLIASVPTGTTLGGTLKGGTNAAGVGCTTNSGTITNVVGGSILNAYGCTTNAGTITTCTGGTVGSTTYGCSVNNGTITNALGSATSHGLGTNNATVVNTTGGSGTSIQGTVINSGTGVITNCTGGSGSSAIGCGTNGGTVTNAYGGSNTNSHGVGTSNMRITNCYASPTHAAHGCATNNGTINSATGGISVSLGVNTNNGIVIHATGGSHATGYGSNINVGQVFGCTDGVGRACGTMQGSVKFIDGPTFTGNFVKSSSDPPTTIYSFNGPIDAGATIPGGTTVIELSAGGGSSTFSPFASRAFSGGSRS